LDFRKPAPIEFEGCKSRRKIKRQDVQNELINRRARAFQWAFAEAENGCEKRISKIFKWRVFDV
jgi:hypothetical protein